MDILQINKFHYVKGGAERYYFELSDLLESEGHSVAHFSMKHPRNVPSPFEEYFVSGVEFDGPASLGAKISAAARTVYSFEARDRLAGLLSVRSFDLAHLHNIYHQLSPSILHALVRSGVPAVLTAHDYKLVCPNYLLYCNGEVCERCTGGRYYRAVIHRCLKNSLAASGVAALEMYLHRLLGSYDTLRAIIAPSRFLRDRLVRAGFPEHKVVTVPNFVSNIPEESAGEPGSYVAYLGRLSHEKGLGTFIRAAAGLRHTEVKIAGDGPERVPLERLRDSLGASNVGFVGLLDRSDVERFILGSSLVVVPSEYYENCPLSILETMALGRPVVGAAIGGIPELIEHGTDGLLFMPGDHVELRESIAGLVGDSRKLRAMGEEARRKITWRYNRTIHYERIMEVYESALAGASSAGS
jgi:glycosyltransferase involved in cell wall biosynthesis